MRSKFAIVIALLAVASMVLAACAPQTTTPTPEAIVETVVVEKEGQTVVVTATPEPTAPPPPEVDLEALKAAVGVKALDSAGNPCTGYDQEDCLTLEVKATHPAPYLHTVLSLWVTYPAKEELIAEGGENWWNSSKYHVGNGPMVLKSLEPFVKATFSPNPNYWGGTATYDMEWSYLTDSAVRFEAYKNGEFDIITLGAEDIPVVKADAALSAEYIEYPGSCTFAVMFHQLKEPFTDQKVREAFAYALDRDAWVRDVLQGAGSPTLTWIPKGFPGYDAEENRWGFDPEKAKAALAESSYGSVDKLPEITATFGDTPRNRLRWEWLTAKWKEVLGVDVKLNPVEPTTFTALTKDINTSPQMFILGWCADYPDPQNWLSVYWKTGAFGERIGYSNPELDAMLNEADAELDTAKRAELYANAQRFLTDTTPVAFMYNDLLGYMINPEVQGLTLTPMDSAYAGQWQPLTVTAPNNLLRVNINTYPDIIDPQKSSFVNEIAHLSLMYEGLTRLDKDLVTVPGAAESWEYNDDATVLTFHLRPGLKYSDGTLLNAKRYEYSIMRNIDPATAGEYAAITDDILGAYEWRSMGAPAE